VENCRSAEALHETFAQGGRIDQIHQQDERRYVDSSGLNARKPNTQAEM
jgi:hypothetical protein